MAVLLETTNSFGRQHHFDTQQSQGTSCAALDIGSEHACSALSFDALPRLPSGGATSNPGCGSMSAFWCEADQQTASPASSSHSASDRWHDAFRDIASATCSSSVPDCSAFLQQERKRSLSDRSESACGLGTAAASIRHSPFQEDARQWQAVDQGPAQREPQAQLDRAEAAHHSQLQPSGQQTEQTRQCVHYAQQQAQNAVAEVDVASRAAANSAADAEARLEAQVAAARLVSGVFGRITGAAAAQDELALLRGRVQHLRGMTSTVGLQPQLHSDDAHDGWQRQLVHVGLAVGCATCGLAGAYHMFRRSG